MNVNFSKFQGTGNDFIIISDRDASIESTLSPTKIKDLCYRRFGIGADGLILIQDHIDFDFKMVYFNSDGNPSSMCGNGGRCSAWFAYKHFTGSKHVNFLAIDGAHKAYCHDQPYVDLEMQAVHLPRQIGMDYVIDTGSPHYVKIVDNFDFDVVEAARKIRYSESYKKEGINVNFVKKTGDDLYVRTYERGVEDETWSCGTGVTAAALIMAHLTDYQRKVIKVETIGGSLAVKFNQVIDDQYQDVWLSGPVSKVYSGQFTI